MQFKSLLLLSASCVLTMNSASAIAAPVRSIVQTPTSVLTKASDGYRNCQQAASAVVTLYSGTEIGAGSIVDADGTILTAQHVVKEALSSPGKVKIYVKLANGNRYVGKAIASDVRNDLALVQIPVQAALPTVALASAAKPQAGQSVCAIGSPSGRTGILSQGTFKQLLGNGDLQSAVRLTYGNSGGPLLNAQGELVGVNKAIWLSDRGENTGISHATSAQVAQNFMAKYHRSAATVSKQPVAAPVPPAPPALFAPKMQPSQPTQTSVAATTGIEAVFDDSLTVQQVAPNSSAALVGLQPGDRLLAINGNRLSGLQQLQTFLGNQPGIAVLTISRNQQVTDMLVNF